MTKKVKEEFDFDFYKKIVDQIHTNIYVTDVENDQIVYMNDFMKETFGITNPEGQIYWRVLKQDQNRVREINRIRELLEQNEERECYWKEYNPLMERTYLNYDVLQEWNGKKYHVQYCTDITENVELTKAATVDELTHLLNRKAGKKRLTEILENLNFDEQVIIALCDINGLKKVNDTYGHHEGDRLLHYVATHMNQELEEPDFMFRLSGDEFIVVFVEKEIHQAEECMQKMLNVLKEKKTQAGLLYHVSFSYGLINVLGNEHLSVSDVLALADTQMYIRKREFYVQETTKPISEEILSDGTGEFEYCKEHLFDAFSDIADGYSFIGNLKTGQFMYSNRMVREFALPSNVIDDAVAFWSELIHPENKEFFILSNKEIQEGKTERYAMRYRAQNARGEWVRLLCKGKMVRDENGNPGLFVGLIYPLDHSGVEGNQRVPEGASFYFVEETIAKHKIEEQLLDFVNCNIPGGIVAVADDEEFSIICFNQSLLEYSGKTYDEFLKATDGKYINFVYEKDRKRMLREIRRQLSERGTYKVSYRIERSDGSIAWVYEVGRYATGRDGKRMILSFVVDDTEEMETKHELYHIKQLYNYVRNYTKISVWEYFPDKDEISGHDVQDADDVGKVIYQNAPDSILARGKVHPDSERVFRRLHEKIKNGADKAVGVICLRLPEEVWERITYISLRDEKGKVVSAVGIGEDVTEQRQAEIRAFNQEAMREMLDEDKIYSAQINLSTQKVEMAWAEAEAVETNPNAIVTYQDVYDGILKTIAKEDDQKRFCEEYNEEVICALIAKGDVTKEFEFRQLYKDGRIIWVNLNFKISASPYTGNIILFLYARNIDVIKKKELSLQKKTELDEVTGLYNLSTTRSMIESFMKGESRKAEEQAYLLIDIDDFRKINETGGFLIGDQLLRQIAARLQKIAPATSVLGRLNGDTFVVYLCQKKDLEKEIGRILEGIRGKYTCGKLEFDVTFSVGAVHFGMNEMNCDMIYQMAHKALDAAKRNGGNRLVFYRELVEDEAIYDMQRRDISEMCHYCLERIQKGESKKEICRTLIAYAETLQSSVVREMVMEMIRWVDYLYLLHGKYEQALQVDRKTGLMNYESYMLYREELNEDAMITLGIVGVQTVNLKKYNQQYGSEKGDECLRFISSLLEQLFGWGNCYRIGRKTFIVVCENMAYEQFEQVYKKLEEELEANYSSWIVAARAWDQTSISVAKIQEQVEEKLAIARNKQNSNQAFSDKTVKEVLENIQTQIADGRFCAFLQPKANAKTGTICGAEALVRLRDQEKGIVPPGRFLPAIEQAGLIRHIDLFVLREVCRIMKQWISQGWAPFPISLNYSRMTILEPNILEETNQIVESYGVPKELIEIEITESIGSIDGVSLKNIVEQFSDSGYKIALDDFGAEYSNVYILYSLKLNTLKLDRRVINDIYHDNKARIVVRNIIDICKQFHIESVAEGVETKEQREVLQDMSCDEIQGYYFNKPLPEEEFYKQYIG